MPVYNIIAHSVIGEDGKVKENIEELSEDEKRITLENNTSALLNDGSMYVIELMHFKEFPYAYNDYLALMDSIEFE